MIHHLSKLTEPVNLKKLVEVISEYPNAGHVRSAISKALGV